MTNPKTNPLPQKKKIPIEFKIFNVVTVTIFTLYLVRLICINHSALHFSPAIGNFLSTNPLESWVHILLNWAFSFVFVTASVYVWEFFFSETTKENKDDKEEKSDNFFRLLILLINILIIEVVYLVLQLSSFSWLFWLFFSQLCLLQSIYINVVMVKNYFKEIIDSINLEDMVKLYYFIMVLIYFVAFLCFFNTNGGFLIESIISLVVGLCIPHKLKKIIFNEDTHNILYFSVAHALVTFMFKLLNDVFGGNTNQYPSNLFIIAIPAEILFTYLYRRILEYKFKRIMCVVLYVLGFLAILVLITFLQYTSLMFHTFMPRSNIFFSDGSPITMQIR